MRRILLSILAVVVIMGLFAATGYAGYRFGFARGVQSSVNSEEIPHASVRPFDEFGSRGMPWREFRFEREFHRGFGMRGFPMVRFGFFSPFLFLGQILLLALIAGLVYWLFARSGWRLTKTVQTTDTPARPVETEETSKTTPPQD